MKSIIRVVCIVLSLSAVTSFASSKQERQLKELETIKAELKPLREQAYLEKDVIVARHKLDDAYRAYWESVRAAMIRLDPAKKGLVKKDIKLRQALGPITSGSRAEDYEKKAAKNSSQKSSP